MNHAQTATPSAPVGSAFVTTDLARDGAMAAGVCCRPLLRRVTDRATGQVTAVPLDCGSTRASVCPACAEKARRLRMHQCREGWHLAEDPVREPVEDPADDDTAESGSGDDDTEQCQDAGQAERRSRSTRRRQDVPDLPRVPMDDRTTGKAFTDPRTGRVFRPSMFLTLTLPSYGKVLPGTGVPVDPDRYDYTRAALDALLFPRLIDRFWQNLRRCAGYRVQYFAAVEPQRRLAPHLHAAVRGAIPRTVLKAVARATYHAVWWPPIDVVVYDHDNPDTELPVWHRALRAYVDPATGAQLPTWEQALDRLDDALDADPATRPMHVLRLGSQVDVKGLLGGTEDSDRTVRYLCKYLTKAVAETYTDPDDPLDPDTGATDPRTRAYQAHIDRLHAHVRVLPCSPRCANWLRYGVQPASPTPGLTPGRCSSKAHDRDNLGLGGRRVLVSRAWTGKTLTEHRADRATVVREVLEAAGITPPDARRCAADILASDGRPRYVWDDVPVTERDYATVISASIRQASRWRHEYDAAKTAAAQRDGPSGGCGQSFGNDDKGGSTWAA